MALRPHPKISLFPLAEYLHASPARRWSIIKSQADPPDEVVALYRRARAATRRYLRSGAKDPQILNNVIQELEETNPKTDWHARDLQNSAEALRRLHTIKGLRLGERVLRTRQEGSMVLGGVQVSVAPAVAVLERGRVGAIKLTFRKGGALTEQEAMHASNLLRVFVQERLETLPQEVDPGLCQIVDVWRGQVFIAPPVYKRRLAQATAACQEIARMWPQVHPSVPLPAPGISPGPLH